MKQDDIVGILTGDVIDSSGLNKSQKVNFQKELSAYFENNPDVLMQMRFYRGDSFQIMIRKEKAAMVAIAIEAITLSIAGTLSRISIGIGAISKIVKDNVLQSEGEAFLLSGHQIDKMKSEGRLMKIAINSTQFQPILDATFHLAESIVLGWKPRQAAVIAQIPVCKTQKEIAEKLEITGAAVSKAVKAANWPSFESFLYGYEETIKIIYP